jgi:menaquinone-9 beta-reductase
MVNLDEVFDVCIVGAGPSGTTCAWYLKQAGKKVLVLDKREFPRDKICGDAVCLNAQVHLTKMGVLQEIEREGKGNWSEVGGLVAPSGAGFIGNSVDYSGNRLVIAIKRMILDEKMMRAVQKAGVPVVEHTTFTGGKLDKAQGVWTIEAQSNDGAKKQFRARVLVAADGAHSSVTQALGIPTPPPDGICSRAYVKAGTHTFDADGIAFYTRELIPGYAAIFKEANGDLNFCTYIIPGGQAKNDDLKDIHHRLLKEHPYISKVIGPNAEIEKMKGAPLRLGGTLKTYYDNMVIIGDAAGHIDPLTGEGIHTAMDGAWMAAEELIKALDAGDLSEKRLKAYEDRWMNAFGKDFRMSAMMARVYTRLPIFVEASARVMQKQGLSVLSEWGRIMTGAEPKLNFLKPRLVLPILLEAAKLLLKGDKNPEVVFLRGTDRKIWKPEGTSAKAA